jgi:serine/threonine-protein kinase HipA
MKKGEVFYQDQKAGIIFQDENGYHFCYDSQYLLSPDAEAISLTFPLQVHEFKNSTLFPFFDGLIPEGWLLDLAQKNWKTHFCSFITTAIRPHIIRRSSFILLCHRKLRHASQKFLYDSVKTYGL